VSSLGSLIALETTGADEAIARLAALRETDGWPQTVLKEPGWAPDTRINDLTLGTAGVLLGAVWALRHGSRCGGGRRPRRRRAPARGGAAADRAELGDGAGPLPQGGSQGAHPQPLPRGRGRRHRSRARRQGARPSRPRRRRPRRRLLAPRRRRAGPRVRDPPGGRARPAGVPGRTARLLALRRASRGRSAPPARHRMDAGRSRHRGVPVPPQPGRTRRRARRPSPSPDNWWALGMAHSDSADRRPASADR
jgi:hypothetical protein